MKIYILAAAVVGLVIVCFFICNPGKARVYDLNTKKITYVAVNDLDPVFIKANVDGVMGTVWVNSTQLNLNTYMQPRFDEKHMAIIKKIQK